jgi:hypothetical protein
MYGSVRGVPGDRHSYRDPFNGIKHILCQYLRPCLSLTRNQLYHILLLQKIKILSLMLLLELVGDKA